MRVTGGTPVCHKSHTQRTKIANIINFGVSTCSLEKGLFFSFLYFFFYFLQPWGLRHTHLQKDAILYVKKSAYHHIPLNCLDSHLSGLSFLLGFEMKSPCPCCQPACSQASGVSVLAVSNAANSPVLPRGRNHRKRSPVLCCVNSKSMSDLLNGSKSFEMPVSHPGAWKCAAHLYV